MKNFKELMLEAVGDSALNTPAYPMATGTFFDKKMMGIPCVVEKDFGDQLGIKLLDGSGKKLKVNKWKMGDKAGCYIPNSTSESKVLDLKGNVITEEKIAFSVTLPSGTKIQLENDAERKRASSAVNYITKKMENIGDKELMRFIAMAIKMKGEAVKDVYTAYEIAKTEKYKDYMSKV